MYRYGAELGAGLGAGHKIEVAVQTKITTPLSDTVQQEIVLYKISAN